MLFCGRSRYQVPVANTDSKLRHHLSVFFSGGVLTLSKLVVGFIRIKYVSFVLGTVGVGFISQAGQMQLLGISLGSLSMAAGVVNRMGAPENRLPDGERRLLSTAFTVQLAASLLVVLVALIGVGSFSTLVFSEASPLARTAFIAVALSIPFSVVSAGYADAVLFGLMRYDLYVRAGIATAVVGTAVTLLLISVWGLPGAFWGMCAMSVLNCTFDVIAVSRARSFREMFRIGFDWIEARALVKYCFVMLVAGVVNYLSRLWIQARVIADVGVDANGLLHVPLAITSYYTPFLTAALWGRLHPAVTKTGDSPEGRHELAIALRLTALVATTVIVTVLSLDRLLVRLAYSPQFLPATSLLPVQLVGDLSYFVAVTFSVYVLGTSRLRVYLSGWAVYYAAVAVVSIELIPSLGVGAVPMGYTITTTMLGAVSLVWFIRESQGEDISRTLLSVLGCFGVVVVQAVLNAYGLLPALQFLIAGVMIATMLRVFLSKEHGLRSLRAMLGLETATVEPVD